MVGIVATLSLSEMERKVTATPRSTFTRSGYGVRLGTQHMVRHNGRWRRVYCCIYGNAGTCYIDAPTRGADGKRDWIVIRD